MCPGNCARLLLRQKGGKNELKRRMLRGAQGPMSPPEEVCSSSVLHRLRRGGTPSTTRLKEDLRRRALARVAEQRAALVQRRRTEPGVSNALDMELQWASMGGSRAAGGSTSMSSLAWTEADEARLQEQLGHEAYLELMAATEEALLRELESDVTDLDQEEERRVAEACAISEYEELLLDEELQELSGLESGGGGAAVSSDDVVLCPLCWRAGLALDGLGFVTCAAQCGLRLDARGATSPPLELLRARLNTLHTDHSRRCTASAGGCRITLPSEQETLGLLAFGCDACGYCARVV